LLDEALDTLVVHHVAMVDDVNPDIESGYDSAFGNDVPTDFLATFVCGIGGGFQLFNRHSHDIGGPRQAMTAGRIELNDVDALLDFVPHGLAELIGAIADQTQTLHLQFPPAWMKIDRVAGSNDVASARQEAWSRYHALVNRAFQGNVDIM
jgi:hypothetical protein